MVDLNELRNDSNVIESNLSTDRESAVREFLGFARKLLL